MSPTFGTAAAKETGHTSGASISASASARTLPLLTAMTLETSRSRTPRKQTRRQSEVAVAGHIQVRGRAADMDQVGLDNRGHLGSFAGAAGDSTRPAPVAGLKRRLHQNS